jgi:hypothetical protein
VSSVLMCFSLVFNLQLHVPASKRHSAFSVRKPKQNYRIVIEKCNLKLNLTLWFKFRNYETEVKNLTDVTSNV